MSIYFENGGMMTTVQDGGRFGYQQFGVSPAGPMDTKAFHLANILVGNDWEESALETTYMGPQIRFETSNIIAVTGADMQPCVDGNPIPMCEAVLVQKDSVLTFKGLVNGCRGYIAFAGGLDIPVVMDSKATLVRNAMGGVEGRKIQKGDEIKFAAPKETLSNMEIRKAPKEVYPSKEVTLRVVLGPQDDMVGIEGIHQFFWNSAVISNEFDRMGCRLECEPLKQLGDGNIISDGIACGAIQIPTNGKPIIMMTDRQTTGGYTKIGNVISVDLPKLAQAQPGFKVRFIQVGIELAQDLYIRQKQEFKNLEQRLGG